MTRLRVLSCRGGEFETLLTLLDPDVVLRADFGPRHPQRSVLTRGHETVARSALAGAGLAGGHVIPALVNGAAGAVITVGGRPFAIMGFIVVEGRIVEIDGIVDPERVRRMATPVI